MKDDTEFLNVVRMTSEKFDEIHKSCGEPAEFFSVESILASCLTAVGKCNRNSQSPARKLALIEAELAKKVSISSRLTIKQVNNYLDRLSLAQNRDTQICLFKSLIGQTNAEEMKCIISIILKDLIPIKGFEALYLAKNHGYFNFEAVRLLSSILKKENNIHLSARWRFHSTVRSATSVLVKLEPHKIYRKFNQVQVGKVYVVYDKPTTSVDVWIATRGPNSKQVQLPDWTNLNTQRMSPLNSRSFLEDEGALISMVLGRGLEPYFFLGLAFTLTPAQ